MSSYLKTLKGVRSSRIRKSTIKKETSSTPSFLNEAYEVLDEQFSNMATEKIKGLFENIVNDIKRNDTSKLQKFAKMIDPIRDKNKIEKIENTLSRNPMNVRNKEKIKVALVKATRNRVDKDHPIINSLSSALSVFADKIGVDKINKKIAEEAAKHSFSNNIDAAAGPFFGALIGVAILVALSSMTGFIIIAPKLVIVSLVLFLYSLTLLIFGPEEEEAY